MSERDRPIPTPSGRSICARRGRGSRRAGGCPSRGSLIGAILGVLASVGGGDVFRARTLLYLGQPFTTSGGGQIQSIATNPKTVSQIIRSEAALRAAPRPRAASRSASCAGNVTSPAVVSAGPGQERLAARRDHGRRGRGAQGRERGELARRLRDRHRLDIRRPEDRPAQQADRLERAGARGHRRSASPTPSSSSSR